MAGLKPGTLRIHIFRSIVTKYHKVEIQVYLSIYPGMQIYIVGAPQGSLSVYPTIYLTIYLSIQVCRSIELEHHKGPCLMSIYPTIYLTIYLSIQVCRSIELEPHKVLCLSIYPTIYLSIYLSRYADL